MHETILANSGSYWSRDIFQPKCYWNQKVNAQTRLLSKDGWWRSWWLNLDSQFIGHFEWIKKKHAWIFSRCFSDYGKRMFSLYWIDQEQFFWTVWPIYISFGKAKVSPPLMGLFRIVSYVILYWMLEGRMRMWAGLPVIQNYLTRLP